MCRITPPFSSLCSPPPSPRTTPPVISLEVGFKGVGVPLEENFATEVPKIVTSATTLPLLIVLVDYYRVKNQIYNSVQHFEHFVPVRASVVVCVPVGGGCVCVCVRVCRVWSRVGGGPAIKARRTLDFMVPFVFTPSPPLLLQF